jgi:ABC-type multidrug transport system fused ATPase/permease subunit
MSWPASTSILKGFFKVKFLNWNIWLGLSLIALAMVLYAVNYLIFRDANYMFRLFLAQLGFLPISVLLVTIIINQLLSQRAKAAKLCKINMVIGAFFSEVGTELLKVFSQYDRRQAEFRKEISDLNRWADHNFDYFHQRLKKFGFQMAIRERDLPVLGDFLQAKWDFLLRLLENPNLLEHDSFANLLLEVSHLTEELTQRQDLSHLTSGDREHLLADIERAYAALISEWLDYMQHLRKNYPFLFSLAWRINPFNPQASAVIE